ncbi:hypothetical protein B9479_005123 [Cryptococcus floricola]|uniref:Uncharacterized protein n=1 Tax=Cryptococcus floricola TaxID=2591691 RepID=A0A5D3ARQ3_9TREE|nr:hypothetical protein B9479_005123 [Cryptococcus floricola]
MSQSPATPQNQCPGDCKPRCATCVKAHSRAPQRAYRSNKATEEILQAGDEAVSRGERVAHLGEDGTSSMPVDEVSWIQIPWSFTKRAIAQSRTGLVHALVEKMTLHAELPNQLPNRYLGSEMEKTLRREIKGRVFVFHGSYVANDDVPDPAKKKEAVKQLAESIYRTFADDKNEKGQKAGFFRFRPMGGGPTERAVETTNKITLHYRCCQDQKTSVPASSSSRRRGMTWVERQSHMSVSYNERDRRFTVRIKYGIPHVTYQRAKIPPEVARERLQAMDEKDGLIVGEFYTFNSRRQTLTENGVATKDQDAEDEADWGQGSIWDEDPETVGIEDEYAREEEAATEARARLTETASMLRRLGDLVESQADGGDVELSKTLEKRVTGAASLLRDLEGMLKKKRKGKQKTQGGQRGKKVPRLDAEKAQEWLDAHSIDEDTSSESGDESD